MTRVVLDTNVLVSGFARPHSLPGELLRRCEASDVVLVLSEHILAEFERTLVKPWFVRELDHDRRGGAVAFLRTVTVSDIVIPDPKVTDIATHPEDDLILATAVAGQADYLVTGDRQLLTLREYESVRIVSPAEFLVVLDASEMDR